MKNLNNLLKILLESDIDFVLVGGYAAVVHGSSQVTQDIDICAVLTDKNIEKLRSLLKDYNPKLRMNPSFQPSFLEQPRAGEVVHNLYLKTDLGILDIMDELRPIGNFERIKNSAIQVPLFGHKCKVIHLDDLIEIKKTMNRDKDKLVLHELEQIKKHKK